MMAGLHAKDTTHNLQLLQVWNLQCGVIGPKLFCCYKVGGFSDLWFVMEF